ncbi:MAG TPA: hypothetical protein PK822_07880, partial [Bacillota bacterium]|nr:hypothetical protein [Bacillota bacterium]
MKQNLATQRTLKALRNDGWLVVVAERWNPYARKRQDLFGWIDLVAIKPGVGIMGVQVCTQSFSAHMKKYAQAELLDAIRSWRNSGGLAQLWVWRRAVKKGKTRATWHCKIYNLEVRDEGLVAEAIDGQCDPEPR